MENAVVCRELNTVFVKSSDIRTQGSGVGEPRNVGCG